MNRLTFLFFVLFPCWAGAQVDLSRNWKFITGNDPDWVEPNFNDSSWVNIRPDENWESQGFADYDGFAWYRIRFYLPEYFVQEAWLKDSVRITLGRIDDADAVYLNGVRIGQGGTFPTDPGGYKTAWDLVRNYRIAANNPALHWNADNVLAVRVYDEGGPGGMFGPGPRQIGMVDLVDFIALSPLESGFDFSEKGRAKTVASIQNKYSKTIEGQWIVQVFNKGKKHKPGWKSETALSLKPGEKQTLPVSFPRYENGIVQYVFKEKNTGKTRSFEQEIPYILTPPEDPMPKINNADVYGARPGVPFLYHIVASGKQPLKYSAKGLPQGLRLDPTSGNISGTANTRGMFSVTLTATNSEGSRSKVVNFIIGDNICLTPPLGWNSWNCWGLSVSDARVRASADAMVKSGLTRHGWNYMNIDDGWEAPERDPKTGEIRTNEKFPDMKALSDYLHAKGLKMGIYSSPGTRTCGGFLGSWKHEAQDAQTWAGWGIDYLKYDWCSYEQIAPNKDLPELKKPYAVMRAALNDTKRDIVYSLCQYGMGDVWQWGEEVGGNLWRTTGDITDTWESLRDIGFKQHISSEYARPGHWNDPDMLIVGYVGWGDRLHRSNLTPSEQYTHISLWAMLSAPMLIGCDLDRIDEFTYNLLANDEVLALNQDALGKQAVRVLDRDGIQIWVKELLDGSRAVAVFNLSDEERSVKINWSETGVAGYKTVRDVWRQKDVGKFGKTFDTDLFAHGVRLLKLYGQ